MVKSKDIKRLFSAIVKEVEERLENSQEMDVEDLEASARILLNLQAEVVEEEEDKIQIVHGDKRQPGNSA